MRKGDLVKDEYDFSGAERRKFFRKGAHLVPPVHLEPEVAGLSCPAGGGAGHVAKLPGEYAAQERHRTDQRGQIAARMSNFAFLAGEFPAVHEAECQADPRLPYGNISGTI